MKIRSKYKLSKKKLGHGEYCRRVLEIKRREDGIEPRNFTGLSPKVLGDSEYQRKYSKLRRNK